MLRPAADKYFTFFDLDKFYDERLHVLSKWSDC